MPRQDVKDHSVMTKYSSFLFLFFGTYFLEIYIYYNILIYIYIYFFFNASLKQTVQNNRTAKKSWASASHLWLLRYVVSLYPINNNCARSDLNDIGFLQSKRRTQREGVFRFPLRPVLSVTACCAVLTERDASLPGAQAGEARAKRVNIGRGTHDFKGLGAANGSGWFCAQAADDSGHIGRRCRGGRSFRGRGDTLARRQVLGCFRESRWHFDTSDSRRNGASCWTFLWLPGGQWFLGTGLWVFAPGRLHQHAHVGRGSGRNHGALPDVPYWLCEGK